MSAVTDAAAAIFVGLFGFGVGAILLYSGPIGSTIATVGALLILVSVLLLVVAPVFFLVRGVLRYLDGAPRGDA